MYKFRKFSSLLIFIGVFLIIASGVPASARIFGKAKEKKPELVPKEETIKLIVIDPGHGGKDAGAIGHGGAMEKDITLSIARRLKERLLENTGAKVLLTREDDEYLALSERTEFANRRKADIFISIHVNAARRRRAHGVEAFFLSFDATDDEARETAAFENNVINLEGKTDSAPMDDIKSILWDLTQTQAHHESSRLAESIYKSLYKAMGGEFRGVKQAPFHVLVGATMPAVLIEVGFISNPREEKKLKQEKIQARMAEAISKGVVTFEGRMGKVAGSYVNEGDGGSERYGKD